MLSVVLPTLNEAANIPEVLDRIEGVLAGISHELIVVDDDSPDRTWEVAEALTSSHPALKVLRRMQKGRDLSRAAAEGFSIAAGDVLLLMDADLQHDPAMIRELYACIQGGADVAVASRYMEGGSVGEWIRGRRIMSKTATVVARLFYRANVTDPMSGFFAIKREVYARVSDAIRPRGFKILLEILAFLPADAKVDEVPLTFLERRHGESKLNVTVQGLYLLQVMRLALFRMQRWLFLGVVIVLLVSILPRLWDMKLLYLDSEVRANVRQTLERIAEDRGWLLSDMLVEEVTHDRIRITHRQHHRGTDEERCLLLPYEQTKPIPCDVIR